MFLNSTPFHKRARDDGTCAGKPSASHCVSHKGTTRHGDDYIGTVCLSTEFAIAGNSNGRVMTKGLRRLMDNAEGNRHLPDQSLCPRKWVCRRPSRIGVFSISPSIKCKEKHERFWRRSTPFRRHSHGDHGLPWQPTLTIGSRTSGSINKEGI